MEKLEKLLFSTIVLVGIIFTFLVPPFQKPDENRHYYQAEALSRGVVTCQTNSAGEISLPIPKDVYTFPSLLKTTEIAHTPKFKFLPSLFGLYPYTGDKTMVQEKEWCSWSSVGYIPNAAGLFLGRFFGSRLIEFYLGRLVGLFVFLALFAVSLRLSPPSIRKWLYFYAFVPMVLHQVSAISYDVVLLSAAPLAFALVGRFLAAKTAIPRRLLLVFLVSLVLIVLTKPAYLLLLGLYFLLPPRWVAQSRRGYLTLTFVYLVLSLILTAFVLKPSLYSEVSPLVNPGLQLRLLISSPLRAFSVLAATLRLSLPDIYISMIGSFGWLDYLLPPLFYYVPIFVLGYLLASQKVSLLLNHKQLLILALIVFGTFSAVFYSLYLIWTPVGANAITGIQGRYFLPVLPFLLVLAETFISFLKANAKLKSYVLAVALLIYMISLAAVIWDRYYNYSQYGPNDLVRPNLTAAAVPLQENLGLPLTFPGTQVKVIGFYYYEQGTAAGILKYSLLDQGCSHLVYSGFTQRRPLAVSGLHEEDLAPLWVKGPLCLKFSLVDPTSALPSLLPLTDGSFIGLRYLIPSLR